MKKSELEKLLKGTPDNKIGILLENEVLNYMNSKHIHDYDKLLNDYNILVKNHYEPKIFYSYNEKAIGLVYKYTNILYYKLKDIK